MLLASNDFIQIDIVKKYELLLTYRPLHKNAHDSKN